MKFQKWVFLILILLFHAAGFAGRKPTSPGQPIKLRPEVEKILSEVTDPQIFNVENCSSYVRSVYQEVTGLSPEQFDYANAKVNWDLIYKNLWLLRVRLRERLIEFSKQNGPDDVNVKMCVESLRDGFRLTRFLEDYLVESFSGEPQDFKAGDPKHTADPKWKPTPFRGESPWTMIHPKFKKITLRSGDMIISRGNAYTSSAIARIGNVDSQFSHLAFIFIPGDGKGEEYTIEEALNNPKVLVLEAHIEVGSTIRKLREYFDDGNARNVIFRFTGDGEKSAEKAHKAAKWTYEYIQRWRKNSFDSNPIFPYDDVNHNVPYNFQMGLENPENPRRLFCSQVAHVGFYSEGIQVPQSLSTMNTKLSLPKRMGISATDFFAPGDLEVDPRFEMVAEYRNVRKLKGLRIKDMVLSGMYRMMEEGYELMPVPTVAMKGVLAWFLRQMDVQFTKPQLPKNMNVKVINTTFTLERAAMFIEQELSKEEEAYKKTSTGLPFGFNQGLAYVDMLKVRDREKYLENKTPGFHWDFRPPHLYPVREPNSTKPTDKSRPPGGALKSRSDEKVVKESLSNPLERDETPRP